MDVEPEFKNDNYSINIQENLIDTEPFEIPPAYYNIPPELNMELTKYYFLKETNANFDIEKTTGNLTLLNPLDRETTKEIVLEIIASRNENGNSNPETKSILRVIIEVSALIFRQVIDYFIRSFNNYRCLL